MNPREPLGNIVVATDFTAHARMAVDRAVRLPLGIGATIELLHVEPESEPPHAEAPLLLEQARSDAVRALAGMPDGRVVTAIRRGVPFEIIADRAHHGRAELIVVGRHGHRRFRDTLLGATAERVIRHGSVSVLVVAGPPQTPYRRPLVAIDMSDSSRHALELAARSCDPDIGAIDVLHVMALPSRLHVGETHLVPAMERRLADLVRERGVEITEWLSSASSGVRCNLSVETGDPRTVILEAARSRGADLIALGTHGRTGLARVLLGSVAEGVIRAAPCDVVVARLPGPS